VNETMTEPTKAKVATAHTTHLLYHYAQWQDRTGLMRLQIRIWCGMEGVVTEAEREAWPAGEVVWTGAADERPTCKRCDKLLNQLTQSLGSMAMACETPDVTAARERRYARRRVPSLRTDVERRVQQIAEDLREMAAYLDRYNAEFSAQPYAQKWLGGPGAQLAHNVLHKMNWGLANLGLDDLARAAGQFDVQVVKAGLEGAEPAALVEEEGR
jgi:hypothetical protein